MFKAIIPSETSISSNTNIPLSIVKDTNANITYDSTNKTIVFNTPGYYKVDFHMVVTNVPVGNITVSEVLNGTASTTIFSTETSVATDDFISVDIPDILSVYATISGTNATLSYNSSVACTGQSGVVTIYKIGR